MINISIFLHSNKLKISVIVHFFFHEGEHGFESSSPFPLKVWGDKTHLKHLQNTFFLTENICN